MELFPCDYTELGAPGSCTNPACSGTATHEVIVAADFDHPEFYCRSCAARAQVVAAILGVDVMIDPYDGDAAEREPAASPAPSA